MIYQHERKPKRVYNGPPAEMPKVCNDYATAQLTVAYLEDRGLDPATAKFNGLYPTYWDVRRLVIPCANSAGDVYFQARRMDDSDELRYRSPANPAADSIVVMWPMTGGSTAKAVITEGPMDALAAACCGFVGVGLMGNQPPPERLDYIAAFLGHTHAPFIVVPDLDSQGFGAELVAAFALRGIASRVAMPTSKDLCEMRPEDRLLLLTDAMKEKQNVRSHNKGTRKVTRLNAISRTRRSKKSKGLTYGIPNSPGRRTQAG